MKRVLPAVFLALGLSMAWSTAMASSHSESPGRRGGLGCAAGQSSTQPTTVARPAHTVQSTSQTHR